MRYFSHPRLEATRVYYHAIFDLSSIFYKNRFSILCLFTSYSSVASYLLDRLLLIWPSASAAS